MAYEDTMFSFHAMNVASSDRPVNVQESEMYRCSQITLSQLQEKVLRSLTMKSEDDNLQVVPQNDCIFEDSSLCPYRESCAVQSRENLAKKDLKPNCIASSSQERKGTANTHQGIPQSPGLRVTPLVAVTTCFSPEPLRTPTFQFSPLLKSPARCVKPPVSPLAMMILSPFGRKPSEDLSMYLPDNFTPAATLERLERSIDATVFEFPTIEEDEADNQSTMDFETHSLNTSRTQGRIRERLKETERQVEDHDVFSTKDDFHANSDDVFATYLDDHISCYEIKKERDGDIEEQFYSSERRRKRRRKKVIVEKCSDVLGFRNKLERKRRSEMNCKYDKLQRCIPEIEKRQKVAKIVILKSATEYIKDLQRQDKLLTKQKQLEKRKNEELLAKLVGITS